MGLDLETRICANLDESLRIYQYVGTNIQEIKKVRVDSGFYSRRFAFSILWLVITVLMLS